MSNFPKLVKWIGQNPPDLHPKGVEEWKTVNKKRKELQEVKDYWEALCECKGYSYAMRKFPKLIEKYPSLTRTMMIFMYA